MEQKLSETDFITKIGGDTEKSTAIQQAISSTVEHSHKFNAILILTKTDDGISALGSCTPSELSEFITAAEALLERMGDEFLNRRKGSI
jgi:L-alanine-DL-glutamate epimerase-like enolase superfamily enzyme